MRDKPRESSARWPYIAPAIGTTALANAEDGPDPWTRSRRLKTAGAALVLALLVVVITLSLVQLDATYSAPQALSVLNLVFQSVALYVVAWMAGQNYLRRNLPQLLVISMAMIIFGTVVLLNSLISLLGISVSTNFLVTGHNLALLAFAALNMVAVLMTFYNFPRPAAGRGKMSSVALAAVASVGVSAALIWLVGAEVLPPFWSAGSTPARDIVLGIAPVLLMVAVAHLGVLYAETRSGVIYWYLLGLVVYAVGIYSILADPRFDGLLIWSGRIAQYAGGAFLILAVLASLGGERWTDAFIRNKVQFDNLFATMGEAFAYVQVERDADGEPVDYRYIRTNDAFARIARESGETGVKRELGDHGVMSELLVIVRELANNRRMERREVYLNGPGRWFMVSAYSPEEDHYALIFSDITEVKQAEMDLRKSEVRYRSLFENSLDAVMLTRPDGTILKTNSAAQRLFRMTDEELIRAGRQGIMVMDDRAEDAIQQRAAVGRMTAELTFRRGDGTLFTGEVTSSLFDDPDGSVKTSMIIRDVTEERAARRWAEDERARLLAVLNAAPVGIFIGDESGRGVLLNKTFYKIWGASAPTPDMVEDYVLYKGWSADSGAELRAEDWPASKALKGETSNIVANIARFDGGHATIFLSAVPLRDHDGKITGNVAVIQDITELRKTEAELRRANDELRQFAYVASHDMQEPLRMVSMYIGLLQRKYAPQLDTTAQEYMHYAVDGSYRMKALIDDLLSYSRLDAQETETSEVDMNRVMDAVREVLKRAIEESGAEIIVHPLPKVIGREQQLIQLIQNLVSNAIKFQGTERPRIEISSMSMGREWRFSVRDNGIGIAREHQEKIFQMFQRLHTKDEYPGTGIGLAIAKKIVERHGGRMWIDSEVGGGSVFFFTLPKGGYE